MSGERDEETGDRAMDRERHPSTGQATQMPREETPWDEASRADGESQAPEAEGETQAPDTSEQQGEGAESLWGEATTAPDEATTQPSAQPVTEPPSDSDSASASSPDQAEQQGEATPSQRPSRGGVSPAPRAAVDPGGQDGAQPGRGADASAEDNSLPAEEEEDFPALRTWLNSEGIEAEEDPVSTPSDAENDATSNPNTSTKEQSE